MNLYRVLAVTRYCPIRHVTARVLCRQTYKQFYAATAIFVLMATEGQLPSIQRNVRDEHS